MLRYKPGDILKSYADGYGDIHLLILKRESEKYHYMNLLDGRISYVYSHSLENIREWRLVA
jgi:hypothetical protein